MLMITQTINKMTIKISITAQPSHVSKKGIFSKIASDMQARIEMPDTIVAISATFLAVFFSSVTISIVPKNI